MRQGTRWQILAIVAAIIVSALMVGLLQLLERTDWYVSLV